MSLLAIHLSILRNNIAIISRLFLKSNFMTCFFKKSYETFVGSFYHEMPPILMIVIWCGMCKFMWSYGIIVFFLSAFFGKSVYFFIAFDV